MSTFAFCYTFICGLTLCPMFKFGLYFIGVGVGYGFCFGGVSVNASVVGGGGSVDVSGFEFDPKCEQRPYQMKITNRSVKHVTFLNSNTNRQHEFHEPVGLDGWVGWLVAVTTSAVQYLYFISSRCVNVLCEFVVYLINVKG